MYSNLISGKAYALGSGELYGELGLGDRIEVDQPTLIDALKNESIVDVQSSCMHTLVLTEQGKIWSWGGNDFGALGREGIESMPRLLDHPSIKYIKFIKVACGYSYSMAISTKGQLYTWGTFTTSEGIFGYLPGTRIQLYPRILDALSNQICIDIAVGRFHALCLTQDGSVYSWGNGEFWQLGHRDNDGKPHRLALGSCQSIACGALHSLAIDQEGQLFSWGQNSFGQCGLEPMLVPEPTWVGLSCQKVAAGDHHTIAITQERTLFGFGRCYEGQLGIALYPGYLYPSSRCIDQRTYAIHRPIKNPWKPTDIIVKLVCGSNSTLAITQSGKLFFWGVSFTMNERRMPALLMDHHTIIHASMGDHFSIFIIKE